MLEFFSFTILFFVLLFVLALIILYNFSQQSIPKTPAKFKKFQVLYLVPYLLMTCLYPFLFVSKFKICEVSDWLQGPYVYALYESYGFTMGEIAVLFIFGFFSSMVFGTFIGSLSDKVGRKLSCCFYAVGYILSCISKHFPNFYILLIGRILGGIATSILFSAFESWMIFEHFDNDFNKEWINFTFFLQVFFNGIIAIVAGQIAKFASDAFGTMVAPFDTAIIFLTLGMIFIIYFWKENYGNKSADWGKNFYDGFKILITDKGVLLLGIAQSLFEASMYIFVFMWTPVLDKVFDDYSHGMVFSIFMICVMAGSSLFNVISKKIKIEMAVVIMFAVSTICLAIPVFVSNGFVVFASFCVFETCVGIFWPSMGTLKSVYIPEGVRSTVMNYFRIPTNFFVLITLIFIDYISFAVVFAICTGLMLISLISSVMILMFYSDNRKYVKSQTTTDDDKIDTLQEVVQVTLQEEKVSDEKKDVEVEV